MRVLAAVASGIAMGLLALGPIAHIRAQQSKTYSLSAPSAPNTPAEAASVPQPAPVAAPSIQVTDQLVRPRIFHTPAPVRPRPQAQPLPQRRSLFARLFLGDGAARPRPFPRPLR